MEIRHDPSFDDAFDDLFAVAERVARRVAGPAEAEDVAAEVMGRIGSQDGGATWLDTRIVMHVEQVAFVDPRHGWAWNAGGYGTTDGKSWAPIVG